jgi:outer membrane receptor protein involved in Fe transport
MASRAQDVPSVAEVVVTAQRREQSLRNVPISISVASGKDIQAQGFRDMTDLQGFTPSLQAQADVRGTAILVRGIGTTGSNLGFEQAAPTFIDGMHFGRGSSIVNAFLDIERVEVLRGPQPVFFGQNAASGALNITTRKPGSVWKGYVLGETGNNAMRTVELAFGGPVSDTLGVRVAVKYDANEGHLTNVWTGGKFPHKEVRVGRVTLRWRPTDALQITAKAEAAHQQTGGRSVALALTPGNPNPLDATYVVYPNGGFQQIGTPSIPLTTRFGDRGLTLGPTFLRLPPQVRRGFGSARNTDLLDLSRVAAEQDFLPGTETRPWHTNVNIDYAFGNGLVLTSLSGFNHHWRYGRITNTENGVFAIVRTNELEIVDTFSQELRLTSPTGGFLEWMAGAYYQKEDLSTDIDMKNAQFRTRIFNQITRTTAQQTNKWLSGFGAATLNLADRWSLDLGGRYTEVNKAASAAGWEGYWIVEGGGRATRHGQVVVGMGPITPTGVTVADTYKTSDFNPQAVLRWRPTHDLSLYAKYAESFKSGGFDFGKARLDAGRKDAFVFGDETAVNYEIGARAGFWDGRATADLTFFWSTFTGLQQSAFDERLGRNIVRNAAGQRVRGVEFDANVAATDHLTLGLNGALYDGKVTSFPGATCSDQEFQAGLCTGPNGTIDRSGFPALNTPNWTYVLNADYWRPVSGNYKIMFRGNFKHSDGYLTDDTYSSMVKMDQHMDLSVILGFGPRDDRWRLSIWGRNLLQPLPTYHPEADIFPDGLVETNVSPSMLRTYGVQLRYDF